MKDDQLDTLELKAELLFTKSRTEHSKNGGLALLTIVRELRKRIDEVANTANRAAAVAGVASFVPIPKAEEEWPLVPKMTVKCICKGTLPDGTTCHGLVGQLLPSSVNPSGHVLWAVSIDGERLWDGCTEQEIRQEFEPLVEHDPNE